MPLLGESNPRQGFSGVSSAHAVDNSAMFNDDDSEDLSRTFGSGGDRRKWTFATWFKTTATGARQFIFGGGGAHDGYLELTTDFTLNLYNGPNGDLWDWKTKQLFRDPHAWYHIVWVFDSNNSTANHRMRFYVNGVETDYSDFTITANGTQNNEGPINEASQVHKIGEHPGAVQNFFDGYLAEMVFLDGTVATPSSFGEFDNNGVWRPKNVSGLSFGTTGFYLDFKDAGSDLGDDKSGNGNDFTNTNSVSQSGDSPTLNFATLSTVDESPAVFSEGALKVTSSTSNSYRGGSSSIALPPGSGKWYVEALATGSTGSNKEFVFGAAVNNTSKAAGYFPGTSGQTSRGANDEHGYYSGSGGIVYSGSGSTSSVGEYDGGDRVALRFDMDVSSPTCKFYVNNVLKHTASLTAGVTYFPHFNVQDSTLSFTVNFGSSGFTYTQPTDHLAISAANMFTATSPAIEDGTAYHQTTLYSGTGSSLAVSQSGNSTFQPDWVWIKGRSGSTEHVITDSVRGVTKEISSNDNGAEETVAQGLTAFGSSGFTVGTDASYNTGSATYAGWQWNAGGSTASNGNGSLASNVRVNQTAGFSIVSYTGNGGSGGAQTVGHGLGAKPNMILIKNLSTTDNWVVYHDDIGFNAGTLNSTAARITTGASVYWNDTAHTSTIFNVNTHAGVNGNGNSMIAYCFTSIPGFSKFSGYIGNNDADGTLVELGFKPAWVMVKTIATTGAWGIYDNLREPDNAVIKRLFANDTAAEDEDGEQMDFLSNGFKLRKTGGHNNSGATYLYMAFAEHPFAGTTPATAS